eukprot:gene27073-32711_t
METVAALLQRKFLSGLYSQQNSACLRILCRFLQFDVPVITSGSDFFHMFPWILDTYEANRVRHVTLASPPEFCYVHGRPQSPVLALRSLCYQQVLLGGGRYFVVLLCAKNKPCQLLTEHVAMFADICRMIEDRHRVGLEFAVEGCKQNWVLQSTLLASLREHVCNAESSFAIVSRHFQESADRSVMDSCKTTSSFGGVEEQKDEVLSLSPAAASARFALSTHRLCCAVERVCAVAKVYTHTNALTKMQAGTAVSVDDLMQYFTSSLDRINGGLLEFIQCIVQEVTLMASRGCMVTHSFNRVGLYLHDKKPHRSFYSHMHFFLAELVYSWSDACSAIHIDSWYEPVAQCSTNTSGSICVRITAKPRNDLRSSMETVVSPCDLSEWSLRLNESVDTYAPPSHAAHSVSNRPSFLAPLPITMCSQHSHHPGLCAKTHMLIQIVQQLFYCSKAYQNYGIQVNKQTLQLDSDTVFTFRLPVYFVEDTEPNTTNSDHSNVKQMQQVDQQGAVNGMRMKCAGLRLIASMLASKTGEKTGYSELNSSATDSSSSNLRKQLSIIAETEKFDKFGRLLKRKKNSSKVSPTTTPVASTSSPRSSWSLQAAANVFLRLGGWLRRKNSVQPLRIY